MRTQKFASLISILLFICSLTIAQTQPSDPDPEKEKKTKEQNERIMQLLDQAIGDAATLRLPQNRAIVFAISGDLYWKFDEKRARELFRSAATELITFNQESEKEKIESSNPYMELIEIGYDPRNEILPLVAKRDAEMALELLVQTRRAKLAEAMVRASQPNAKTSGGDMLMINPEKMKVNQELALEQRFALLAADENPDKAIKLIKDSLSRGISTNVLPLLQKLYKKDEKKAAELSGDVIKKFIDLDLTKSDEDMQAAMAFLQFAFKQTPAANAKDKQFAFTEAQIKDLANKIAATLLQPSKSIAIASMLRQAMPMLEKFVPDKTVLLRQRQAEFDATMPPEYKRMQDQQKLFDANATPEDILAQYPKLQNEFEKIIANQALMGKINQIEDEARAKKLIDQIPDEKTRASAQETFEAAKIGRSAGAGKLDEAKKMIGNLTRKKTQIQRLVALAMDFQRKGGEKDVETAKALMKDARTLTSEYAETNDDIADVMEVVVGYIVIDKDTAFRMFEPVVDRINEHVQATSVLAKFNSQYTAFRKGEMVFKVNGNSYESPLFRYIPQMQSLAKADLERMNVLADRFARNDSRAIVKMYVLQGFLMNSEDIGIPASRGGATIIFNE